MAGHRMARLPVHGRRGLTQRAKEGADGGADGGGRRAMCRTGCRLRVCRVTAPGTAQHKSPLRACAAREGFTLARGLSMLPGRARDV